MSTSVISTGVSEIPGIVSSVRQFFNTGATRSYEWRRTQLLGIKRMLTENEAEIGKALAADLHKPLAEWGFSEVSMPVTEINDTLDHLKEWMKIRHVGTPLALLPASSYLIPEPYGVVLVIGPFNYPVQLSVMPLAAALAAGNTVILKPSELTPATSELLGRLIPRYVDPLAVRVVQGAVPETQALLRERWDYVFFTGSERVGKIVMKACAENLTPCTLELGGKSPTIVDKNCDLTLAARRVAWGKFMNAGQTCVAPDYVYVHSSVKTAFLEAVKKTITQFYGANPSQSNDYGRIVSKNMTSRLENIINAHKNDIVVGGQVNVEERFVAPTILDITKNAAPNTTKVMEEEIFGPILPILEFQDVKQVIDFINNRPKPLALYIFSNDTQFQNKILYSTSAGGVTINDTILHLTNKELPFGGVGSSGFGAYHGKYSFDTFSHKKSVLNKSIYGDAPIRYPPYTPTGFAIFRWIGEIYRVNDQSFKRFFKFVLLPTLLVVAAKKYGVSVSFNSNL